MRRVVLSTVGTSLLTNQSESKAERDSLYNEANRKDDQVSPLVKELITKLKEKAINKLNGTVEEIRRASAELNGIYGLYEGKLEQGTEQGKQDFHFLIATDTTQGLTTAQIVQSFLQRKGFIVEIPAIGKLSTTSTDDFTHGITELIKWIDATIPGYKKSGYQIYFNLVGGFKSLQAYVNTIGMFYADEIIYIFEGQNSQAITIPRLPIEVKKSEVEPYKVPLAMMDCDREVLTSWEETKKIPLDWVLVIAPAMTLSTWGQLIWNQCKEHFLSQDKLLKFPNIEYLQTFMDDYETKPADERIILQENLARAACLLSNNTDGISAMKQDGIFRLRRYKGNHKNIDHFDLPKDRRVSCIAKEGTLYLRHYGEHDYVNDNP